MKTLYAIIAIIVAIAVTASIATVVVLPSLQPPYAKFNVVALDYAFDKIDFNPEHHVKAHQIVWIVLSNEGQNDHEFLLFTNRTNVQAAAEEDLAKALSDHPNWATNASEKEAALAEYDSLHDSDSRLERYNNIDYDIAAGAPPKNILFIIDNPGTYYFACHQVDTSTTPWMVHQSKGMWGTLVVEP